MTTSWYTAADCRLEDFQALVERKTDPTDYPSPSVVAAGRRVGGRRGRPDSFPFSGTITHL